MGHAISPRTRLEIVEARKAEKLSYRALAARFHVNYHSVRKFCRAFEERGESSLVADYSTCGRTIAPRSEKVYRLVRLIKHFHPSWGVPYILTRLRVSYPGLVLQSARTYQRRLKKDCPKEQLPAPEIPREPLHSDVRQAHDEWQVDAKEQIQLPSGDQVSYLNVTDTKSNALLKAKAFPPGIDPPGLHGGTQAAICFPVRLVGPAPGCQE